MAVDSGLSEYRTARSKIHHGYLLAAVLGVIGLAVMLFDSEAIPDSTLVGGMVIAVAVVVLVAVHRLGTDTAPRLVLDDDGIWYKEWAESVIPWSAIKTADMAGSRMNTCVAVTLRDPDGYLMMLPADERKRLQENRLVRLPELRIPNGTLDAPLERILDDIQRRVRRSQA